MTWYGLSIQPKGDWRVAAVWRTKLLLHSGVGDGGRPTTHHRAEPARERPLCFGLVQVPGVPVDALERVNAKRKARRWNRLSKPNGIVSFRCWCVYSVGGHCTICRDRGNDCLQLLKRFGYWWPSWNLTMHGQIFTSVISNNFHMSANCGHFKIWPCMVRFWPLKLQTISTCSKWLSYIANAKG